MGYCLPHTAYWYQREMQGPETGENIVPYVLMQDRYGVTQRGHDTKLGVSIVSSTTLRGTCPRINAT